MTAQWMSRLVNVASFGRVKYGWWSSTYRSATTPIIIGGCGRSGTTLFRVMLNAHRHLSIGPENGVFSEGGTNLAGMVEALGLPAGTLRALYRKSSSLGEFIDRTMAASLEATGKLRWGIKAPNVVHSIPVVFQFFPGARFLHMIRDGRDVVCSLRTHPKYQWEGGERVPTHIVNPWESCVQRWVRDTTCGLRWRGDPRYREVRYEDLVESPERVLREVLGWLGEPWDDAVLDYASRHRESGSDAPNPGVKRDLYKNAMCRWRQDLPSEAGAAFTRPARDLLVELGYADADSDWVRELDPAGPGVAPGGPAAGDEPPRGIPGA